MLDGAVLGDVLSDNRIIKNLECNAIDLGFEPVRPDIPELTGRMRLTVQDMGPARTHIVQIPDPDVRRPAGPDEVLSAESAESLPDQGEILSMRNDVFMFMTIQKRLDLIEERLRQQGRCEMRYSFPL